MKEIKAYVCRSRLTPPSKREVNGREKRNYDRFDRRQPQLWLSRGRAHISIADFQDQPEDRKKNQG
jgi:hypothetical protein